MSKFQEFLNKNTVDNLTAEVIFSERLKDNDGKFFKAKIKAMTDGEFEDYRKRSMTTKKGGKFELDLLQFNSQIVVGNTLDPNFKDADSIKSVGAATPQQYLSKVLLAGEIAELSKQIQRFSGFETDLEELKQEVKKLMKEGDGETMYAYYALLQFYKFPHEVIELPRRERAAVYAFIDERVKEEKKLNKSIKKPKKR